MSYHEILKVQVPFTAKDASVFWVYSRDRDLTAQFPKALPDRIGQAAIEGRGVAYFQAEYTHGLGWIFGPQIENKHW